jgi:hypothetical protein
MPSRLKLLLALFTVAGPLCLAGPPARAGLDPEANVDGFDPAAENNRINEARRRNNVERQLNLIYQMQWENPYFPGEPPIRQPIGYESKQVAPNRWIYRPLYAEDVAPGQSPPAAETLPTPAPDKAAPQAPGPADAQPGDLIPPRRDPVAPLRKIPPQNGRRPREF